SSCTRTDPGGRAAARGDPGMRRAALLVLVTFLPPPGFLALAALGQPAPAQAADSKQRVTGRAHPNLVSFDRMMTAFMKRHTVPGAALAVTKDGRLVYARGFGYADVGRKEPVQPNSLMRIASISKPITAVAILLLVQQGKLRLTDRVFDVLKNIEPHLPRGGKVDPRLKKVTVQEVLQHTGGWDREKSFDPMFRSVEIARELKAEPPAAPAQIIRYMGGKP